MGRALFPSEVVIGLVYSTDPSNQFMESKMFSAARAYADWYNETTRGRKIRLVAATYLADPTAALGELKEKGALGVISFSSSSASLEALSGAAHYKLPLVSTSASSSLLSRGTTGFFGFVAVPPRMPGKRFPFSEPWEFPKSPWCPFRGIRDMWFPSCGISKSEENLG